MENHEPYHEDRGGGSPKETQVACINIEGMTCHSCEAIIKKTAMSVYGVIRASADYAEGTGTIEYYPDKTKIKTVMSKIEEKGYTCSVADSMDKEGKIHKQDKHLDLDKSLLWIIVGVGAIITLFYISHFVGGFDTIQLSQHMSYGLLFAVGLLTGFHCVSMCGGFVVGYTAKDAQEGVSSNMSHLKYAAGKTISYTVIGAAFGLLGSFIAFTPTMRGIAGLLAGMFLVIYGMRMLNIFPTLRKIRIPMPAGLSKFMHDQQSKSSSPFKIGLLNGLMIACGPLQAIYIMAAGTGSMIEGAKLLFVFALGTLPVMLGFAYVASFVSGKMTQKFLKVSGAIVILLGLVMLNNGLLLTGSGYDIGSVAATISAPTSLQNGPAGPPGSQNAAKITEAGYQEIRMEVNRNGWAPDTFTLVKDVPVGWIINGKEITSCNKGIQVPKYGLNFEVEPGEQVIEFTPTESGVVPWSCWMGMIPGKFIVQDKPAANNLATGLAATGKTAEDRSVSGTAASGSAAVREVRMEVNRFGYSPDSFTIKKGAPVKWVINGKELNGCNRIIQSQKLGLRFEVKPGEQTIEFTPTESGVVQFTCGMGMLQGTFIVTDDGLAPTGNAATALNDQPAPRKMGGCGCGMMAGGTCGMNQ